MQTTQAKEPLVRFISHNIEFPLPVYPRHVIQTAESMPSLNPYTKTIFSIFRPNAHLRVGSNWIDTFEFNGRWGGHISLAWYGQGKWLFASRNGPAVLGGQAGIFDFARFEWYRRRFAPLQKALEKHVSPPQIKAEWERQTGKLFNPPPPILLELWVIANQTPYSIKVLENFSRSFGEVSSMGISCFLTWRAGRYGLHFVKGKQRVGSVLPNLLYERSGRSEIEGTVVQVFSSEILFKTMKQSSNESKASQWTALLEQVFDSFVLVFLDVSRSDNLRL